MTGARRWIILAIVVFAAIAGVVFLRWGAQRTPSESPSRREVTIAQWGQERYLIYLPLYIAIEGGYFNKRGVDATISFTGNDDQTFAAVIGGSAQFGVGDPAFAAISNEKGFAAKVVATIVGGVAIWGLSNRPNLGFIDSPANLAGLRIGTFPAPSTNYTLMKETIDSHQPQLSKTKIVQAPIGSQLALLQAGAADVAMELEPATSIAEDQGYRVVYSSPKFYGPYAFTGLTTTARLCQEDPSLVAKVVEALEEAVIASHSDPTIAMSVARKLFPTLKESVVRAAVQRMMNEGTFPQHVGTSREGWARLLQTRLAVGDLKKPQNFEIAVDNSFADAAKARLPTKTPH